MFLKYFEDYVTNPDTSDHHKFTSGKLIGQPWSDFLKEVYNALMQNFLSG